MTIFALRHAAALSLALLLFGCGGGADGTQGSSAASQSGSGSNSVGSTSGGAGGGASGDTGSSGSAQSPGITPAASVTVPAAATGVNVAAGNAQVTVSWTAASGATSYNIYRSTTQGTQGARIGSSTAQQYTDSSVANGVTYFYEVTAVNSAGEGPASTQSGGAVSVTFMGSNKVRIGGAMPDATAAAAPFDVRYAYVHSQPAPSSDYYTASLCQNAWTNWWGCWSGSTTPPGYYVTWWNGHVAPATWQGSPRPQIFFWTWYSLRDLGDLAGSGDGPGEVVAINRLDLLTRYMNDYRFFLQTIGNSRDMIDLEPDFWGYVRSLGNPHQVQAQVSAANPTDCGAQENSAAGLARCLISMARKYAPNTTVGMHLSCWDWQTNTQGCGQDYLNLGATNADFLVADVSDRDAGWYAQPAHGGYNNFWNDQKAAATLSFYKTMAETIGKPVALWQIPVGNMAQNNTLNHYQDDKVDWFFSHMDQVADAHIVALLFGAGQQEQTGPDTDGGNLINKTINYWNSGGTSPR